MNFRETVQEHIDRVGATLMADVFEVSEATVQRWANGAARPHPKLQEIVMAWALLEKMI